MAKSMGLRSREERRTIFLKARLRTDDGWRDVTVANISSRGLMLRCPSAPRRGSFIEVRHRGATIIGRVAWSQGARCGVRAQDVIDIADLLAPASAPCKWPAENRRAVPRPQLVAAIRTRDRVEQSHRIARILNWSIVGLGGAICAVLLADTARAAFERPATEIVSAFTQSR
jgi:hypothetical protein